MKVNHDYDIVKTKTNKWYICFTVDIEDRSHFGPPSVPPPTDLPQSPSSSSSIPSQHEKTGENQACSYVPRVIAFDPGVHTCMTGFSSTGEVIQWGTKADMSRLFKYGQHLIVV